MNTHGASVSLIIDRSAVTARQQSGEQAYGLQAREVLDHLRLGHSVVDDMSVPHRGGVVIISEADAADGDLLAEFEAWVREGGVLVLTDRMVALAALGGVTTTPYGNGLVSLLGTSWTQSSPRPLRAISGCLLNPVAEDVETLATWVAEDGSPVGAAITRRPVGSGEVICVGVDLWETIVRIQQGHPVHEDHAPAADGSAPLDDGILKCEDGLALDLDHDRAMPPGEPPVDGRYPLEHPPVASPPIFDLPQADLWSSTFAQIVWAALDRTAGSHGWLHYWPAGVRAVAHMSHDADGNQDEDARAALDAFAEAQVKVTWCQIYRHNPYSPQVYEAITTAGHEHALHFNAMDDAGIAQWGWEQAKAQYAWAQDVIGVDTKITSNKNHYTRWEGWTEFYTWCEQLGITLDESRGPSKVGTVGFPFGTAHVTFPLGDLGVRNRRMDVLNLPLHVQDIGWFGHPSCRDVILDGASQVHGVAHFLFHGLHLRLRPAIRAACLGVAAAARQRGMLWWTAREIDEWERARRGVDVSVRPSPGGDGQWSVTVTSRSSLTGAGVLVALPTWADSGPLTVRTEDGTELNVARVVRHGRSWCEITADLAPGTVRWTVAGMPPATGDGQPIDRRQAVSTSIGSSEMGEK